MIKKFKKKLFISLTLVMFIFLLTSAVSAEAVEFKFNPGQTDFKGEIDRIFLAGSFNDWQPTVDEMNGPDENGIYTLKYNLRPGEYQYKFVINGKEWFHDPNNDQTTADGHGGKNSIINVEEAELTEAKTADGIINNKFIKHNPKNRMHLNKIAENKVQIIIETRKNDVEKVSLLTRIDSKRNKINMNHYNSDYKFDYWSVTIDNVTGKLEYSFSLNDADNQLIYHKNGAGFDRIEYFTFNINDQEVFAAPDWVQNAIFYQIFPDRFNNGNPNNDPELIETYRNKKERYQNIIPEWYQGIKKSEGHQIKKKNFTDNDSSINPKSGWHIFYGGDLQGVEEKFEYLKALGINAIYFNPIFEATANHRYNAEDYKKIDDNLAVKNNFEESEEYFKKFIKKAHNRDIKIVLDAVFNHSGFEFFAFQDVVEKAKDSKYSDWFYIDDYPVLTLYEQRTEGLEPNYKGWAGYGNHPVLNLDNPEVKKYIYEVTEKWMDPNGDGNPEDGIDGWRLDVANDVKARHPNFWKKWRDFVKNINSDAYITGEIWNNASQYLQGDEFDAVMNYRFREAVLAFIAEERIDADTFVQRINAPNVEYPEQSVYSMQNLLDSHDTERFLYSAAGNKDKLKMAAALQFSYSGAPMIYYGTEVGMSGANDPDNRRTMIWKQRPNGSRPDKELYKYYSKLAEIRKNNEVLRTAGVSFEVPANNKKVIILKRENKDAKIYTILNANAELKEVSLNVNSKDSVKELISENVYQVKNNKITLKLPAFSAKILKIK